MNDNLVRQIEGHKKFHKCQVFAVKVIYYIESIETGKNIALNVKK